MKLSTLRSAAIIMAFCAVAAGCGQKAAKGEVSEETEEIHTHEAHDHDGHNHEAEGHDHSHEGHNHEAEAHEHSHEGHNHEAEGHDHEAEGHSHSHEAQEVAAETHEHHDGEIELSHERQEELGIETSIAERSDFSGIIKVTGKIEPAVGDEATIAATSSGIISLARLTEGSAVSKGGRIASISSKGIGGGDQLAKARIAYETAKKEYERDLQLSKDDIVSESHLDQSKLAYEQAKSEYEALGGDNASTSGGITVTSPISGYITAIYVSNGEFAETGSPIASVSQNRVLRLRADVPENSYAELQLVKDANFRTAGSVKTWSVSELGGRLISKGRNAVSGYIPVTFEFSNRGDILPGSYADVFLKTSVTEKRIAVPVSALVEDQGVVSVFIRHEPECFVKREVKTGLSDGFNVEIISGLAEGEEVVTKGAVSVKLASVSAVPVGHTHNH